LSLDQGVCRSSVQVDLVEDDDIAGADSFEKPLGVLVDPGDSTGARQICLGTAEYGRHLHTAHHVWFVRAAHEGAP